MPRNLFVPLTAVPMNVPLSSVTIGQVLSAVGEAKTVAVTTQTATSNAWRKTISAREKDEQTARETSGRHFEKESRL
jgi:predicted solute-binding protein